MKTSQFEAVKVAIKQDKTGYILTLAVHPDEVPDEILRDFVGARYQVVMVRLNGDNQPMDRKENSRDPVKLAALLCKDLEFMEWLFELGNVFTADEESVTAWLKEELNIVSRAELKNNEGAAMLLYTINEEFKAWKRKD